MSFLDCSRAFVVVFIGLILATVGICLTMAGWFAPPINDSVKGVRLAGPALLVIGLVVLGLSCIMCAVKQDLCCQDCVRYCYNKQGELDEEHLTSTIHANVNHTDAKPLDPPRTNLSNSEIIQVLDAYSMVNSNKYVTSPKHDRRKTNSYESANWNNGITQNTLPGNKPANENKDVYHVDETTTDSQYCESLNSNSKSRRPMIDETQFTSAVHHTTMFEGMGVRVKQFNRGHAYTPLDTCETNLLLDQGPHSPPQSPYSSPQSTARMSHSSSKFSIHEDNEEQETSLSSPNDKNTYSDFSISLPGQSPLPDRLAPLSQSDGSSKRRGDEEDPSWPHRVLGWETSPTADDMSPPSYRDMFVLHSDV